MKGFAVIGLGLAAIAAAAVLGPAAFAGKPKTGDEGSGISRADLVGVNFVENCRYSHQAPDDPIVFPGQPGLSHQHTFVGNRTTNAFSSFGSLRSSGTTCLRSEDTAAYWVPALYQGTTEVLPVAATVYYRRGTVAEVSPFPNNLRMIAGDAKATSPQGMRVTFWSCGIASGVRAVDGGAHVSRHARLLPAAAHPLPGVLGRAAARQLGPQEPYGVCDTYRLPVHASRRGASDHADLPIPLARRRRLRARIGRRLLGTRRLPERVEAGGAPQARGRLPERPRPLRARVGT